MKDFFTGYDFLLSVVWLFFIYTIAVLYKRKYQNINPGVSRHIIPALTLKLIGGIAVCIIYNYVYGFGDTLRYFYQANKLTEVLYKNPEDYITLLLSTPNSEDWGYSLWSKYLTPHSLLYLETSLLVIKLTSIVQVISQGGYIPTTILLATLTCIVYVKFYIFITDTINFKHPLTAVSIFYFPSVFLWGSAVLKDSYCNVSILQLIMSTYALFFERKKLITHSILILIAAFIVFTIKAYILLALIPSLALMVVNAYNSAMKPSLKKLLIVPVIFVTFITLGVASFYFLAEKSDKFSLDKVEAYSQNVRDDLQNNESYYREGSDSRYRLLGDDQGAALQPVVYISALFTAYFRPFIWEANNALSFISTLEVIFMIVLFLYYRNYPFSFNSQQPVLIRLFRPFWVFLLVFGIAVGLTSTNFGNLVRYRIPALPFVMIVLLAYRVKGTGYPLLSHQKTP